ncbi:hypothetical protein Nocox_19895 [Nonomuraea coxensis DSM 45129]|uniref:Uncharacterized protein n=1 Tax=Nonomuraea coxensis DSM 45129 TaxID=1122611 RepID=A0ABX8U1Z7_9ACTN|nr:hypothetical protein [Nonomuraea coxensis]QYC41588.1 hypothetical protein Nocox_19895 [Nonomuraea coxensis DSM 45129]
MVERRGKDREVFGKTFREKRASTAVSYDIIPGVKVPAGRRLYFAVDSTFVKKGATMRCAGRTAAV